MTCFPLPSAPKQETASPNTPTIDWHHETTYHTEWEGATYEVGQTPAAEPDVGSKWHNHCLLKTQTCVRILPPPAEPSVLLQPPRNSRGASASAIQTIVLPFARVDHCHQRHSLPLTVSLKQQFVNLPETGRSQWADSSWENWGIHHQEDKDGSEWKGFAIIQIQLKLCLAQRDFHMSWKYVVRFP